MTKTILVTGATDGIGQLTARYLADQGHKVLLHGRSEEKLKRVAAEFGENSETFRADLSSLDDTRALVASVSEKHNRVDVLINNAGILKSENPKVISGRDIRFEVNTLAPYVLTLGLLPIIPSDGRIINLSSAAQAPVDLSAMAGEKQLNHMDAYSQSKLAITIWSAELARELPNGPAIIAVNPGSLLASKMVKDGFGIEGNDLSVGADILVRAALSDEFSQASGKYYDNDAGCFGTPHPAARDANHVDKVMQAIKAIVGKNSD